MITNSPQTHASAEHVLQAVDPAGRRRASHDALTAVAPELARLTLELGFGEIWARPELSLRDRSLVTMAALCATGRERNLESHIRGALALGVRRSELAELFTHLALYAGWPAAVNGALVAKSVFDSLGSHELVLGATRVTVISDGHAVLPVGLFAGGITETDVSTLLAAAGRDSSAGVHLGLNGMVIEHAGHLIVVDPGAGDPEGAHAHGLGAPSQGRFMDNLREAGFDPLAVDLVILTHGHHDHAGGLFCVDGTPAFPGARIAISEAELEHWAGPADFGAGNAFAPQPLLDGARAFGHDLTQLINGQFVPLIDGAEIVPGLRAVAAPGHTLGQMALELVTDEGTVLITGDAFTDDVIHTRSPTSHLIIDQDPGRTASTRQALSARAAKPGVTLHAFHFPFPGYARNRSADDGVAAPAPACGVRPDQRLM